MNFSHELNMVNYVGTNYPTYKSPMYFTQDCTGRASDLKGDDNIDFSYRHASHNGEYLSISDFERMSFDLPPRALLRVFEDETDVGKVPSTLYGTYFNENLSDS